MARSYKRYTEQDMFRMAHLMVEDDYTCMEVAQTTGASDGSVFNQLNKELPRVDKKLYVQVRVVVYRHIFRKRRKAERG